MIRDTNAGEPGPTPGDESAAHDRRSLLKGIGIAGAATWVAPAVVGFASAAAQASPAGCDNPGTCGSYSLCGEGGPFGVCICQTDDAGAGFCWADDFCGNLDICETDVDCPTGYRCLDTCCGRTCMAPCEPTEPNKAVATRRAQRGYTASGL